MLRLKHREIANDESPWRKSRLKQREIANDESPEGKIVESAAI